MRNQMANHSSWFLIFSWQFYQEPVSIQYNQYRSLFISKFFQNCLNSASVRTYLDRLPCMPTTSTACLTLRQYRYLCDFSTTKDLGSCHLHIGRIPLPFVAEKKNRSVHAQRSSPSLSTRGIASRPSKSQRRHCGPNTTLDL